MRLLALDTAAEQCSVALWLDDAILTREALSPPTHAERILPMVEEVLAEAELRLTQLQAVAFGRGPGAFTGVRLAASVAQGLAFAAGLPIIGISDLAALAQQAFIAPGAGSLTGAPGHVLVCQDARMAEVYWACYRRATPPAANSSRVVGLSGVELFGREQVGPAAGVEPAESPPAGASQDPGVWWGVGSGFAAYPELAARLADRLGTIRGDLRPHAREIAQLAAWAGMDAARPPEEALPVYLRDNVATPPQR